MRISLDFVLLGLVCSALVALPAHAAASKAKLTATPAQMDLGSLDAGVKRRVSVTLANQGTAEAKKVSCKGSGFTFDKKDVTIAAGAQQAIPGTYTAAAKAPAKDKAVSSKITCGSASVAVKGILLAKAVAKPAAVAATPAAVAQPAEPAKSAASAGVKAKNAPDKMVLNDCKDKKAGVPFAHKEHFTENKIACDTCHHTQKGLKAGSDTAVKKCAVCHLNPTDKAPSCQDKSTSKNPFHVRCIGCHKDKGDPKAPTKCTECHKG